MSGQASAGIQIDFSDLMCSVGECGGRAFEVTPAGTLEPGDAVVFNVYGATAGLLEGLTLMWGGRLLSRRLDPDHPTAVSAAIEETLSFRGVDKMQLKYPGNNMAYIAVTDIMQEDKTTNALSLFAAAGSVINLSAPTGSSLTLERIGFSCVGTTDNINLYGTIKVSYNQIGYKLSWDWGVPVAGGDHYFYLLQNAALAYSHMITISLDDYDTTSPVDVVLVVREYTTDVLLSGAAVKINGVSVGNTDSDGRINIGSKPIGRYTIKITKSGYVDSDLDDLENDSFIVGGS